MRETFTSKVTIDRKALEIRADYLDGPFRSHGEQLDVQAAARRRLGDRLRHRLRVPSRTLALLMGAVFDRVFRTFADAFEARADKIYGKRASA